MTRCPTVRDSTRFQSWQGGVRCHHTCPDIRTGQAAGRAWTFQTEALPDHRPGRSLRRRATPPQRPVGFTMTDDIQDAHGKIPAQARIPAYDGDRQIRDSALLEELAAMPGPY
jgi:hypothetical protein